ncbi:MAG: epoxyalkane--coenzyme M transferase, partial [Betaproteobacteria bacterium]|nr:epoxyalkane--coenzyme M transferase [Betaproteobacteria bacterium]
MTKPRILTTHVGSLPRPQDVVDLIFAKERGDAFDQSTFDQTMQKAVREVVSKQIQSGIDIVSDGEMSKISYATYIKDRYSGFDGDSPRRTPADLEAFPGFLTKIGQRGGT